MDDLHQELNNKNQAYSSWHQHPRHQFWHWLTFLSVSIIITIFTVSSINNYAFSYDDGLANPIQELKSRRPEAVAAEDHILVKFKENAGQAKKAEVLAKHGLKEKSEIKQIGVKIVEIDMEKDTVEEVLQRIKNEKDVEFAELDMKVAPELIPNDPQFPSQWEKTITNTPQAWDTTTGDPSMIVAILDTGTDCTHPDLAPACIAGWNTYDNNSDSRDIYGHGTAVAGTASAIGNNAEGVTGQAWTKIMPVRVSDLNGWAYYSDIAEGVTWAVDRGAKVVNNSFLVTDSSTIWNAGKYAKSKGALFVLSGGNEGIDKGTPAVSDIVVASASDPSDAMYGWSSFGNHIDVAAPGCVTTTANGGGYRGACGTSFSSPMTAGTLALIFAARPTLTPNQAESILYSTAKDLGAPGWDKYYGWGRIDAAAAVSAAQNYNNPGDTLAPSAPSSLTATAVSATQVSLYWSASTDNEGVAGYNIYRDGTKIATSPGNSYTNSGLTANTTYSYTVSAFDAAGNVSTQSNTATVTTPAPSVSITSFQVTNKTMNSATITWTTNIPSTGSISYGTNRNSLTLSATDGVVATTHTVNLTGLNKGATYYYKILSTSQDGTSNATTNTSSFKTARK